MALSDPAGMLRRMPELEPIASQDERIAAALATGDSFKVYGALRWASWLGRLSLHQPAVDALLANRRLFAKPVEGSPSLFTLNSLGVGFVGETENDSDGTYITGHYVVILFKLPLFPLGAYVVAPGDSSSSYRIFARVPQSGFAWAWSRLVALAFVLFAASGAWGAFQSSRVGTVTIANGFKRPLQIELGDQRATVQPGATADLTLPVGLQQARAVMEGAVVDEGPLNVTSGLDALVWNVGGVSPIFKYEVNYYAVEPAWPPPPRIDFFCGQRVVAEANVDFLFREPDKSISMSKGQKVVSRTLLSAQWRQPGEEGRAPCVTQLYFEGKAPELARVADALRRAGELTSEEETLPIITGLLAREDEAVWKQARELHERRAGDLMAERTVIWAAQETGHLEELRAELSARRDEKPDDADREFLLLRAAELPPTLSEAEAVLKKFPNHDGLRRLVQLAANREGQWDRSLAVWTKRFEENPHEACGDAEQVTRAAVPLHREAQVLEVLDECESLDLPSVVAVTRLAMAANEDTEPWLERLRSEPERQRVRLLAGLPVKDVEHTPLEPTARFIAAARKSPDALFAELPNLPVDELQTIEPELALVVWAEAVRRNHSSKVTFARRTRLTAWERDSVERFVSGTEKELDVKHLNPLARAVAYLTRSRVEGVGAAERERLQKLGREDAVLSGFVLSTLEHWPSP